MRRNAKGMMRSLCHKLSTIAKTLSKRYPVQTRSDILKAMETAGCIRCDPYAHEGGDERTHHIHIFEKNSQAEIKRHLAVRDYLRSHPDTAREYGDLKKQLAARYPHDNDGYCDGKEAYMRDLAQKALSFQWDCASASVSA